MHSYSGGVAALAFLCGMAAGLARAAAPDAAVTLLYQDNVSRADHAADRESDVFAQASAGVEAGRPVGLHGRLWARGEAGVEQAFSWADLSSARLGGAVGGAFKWGVGPRAPRVEATVPVDYAWFGDPDRDRWQALPTLTLRKRLTEGSEVDVFIRHEAVDAAARLFDGAAQEGGLTWRWRGEGAWSVFAGYRLRDGDVVAYATPPRPDLVAEAELVVVGLDTFDRPMNGYRLDARTHRYQVGVGFAVDELALIEAGYAFQETRADDVRYDDHILQVGWRRVF